MQVFCVDAAKNMQDFFNHANRRIPCLIHRNSIVKSKEFLGKIMCNLQPHIATKSKPKDEA